MRLRFGPDDDRAFQAARRRLVAAFEATPAGGGLGWVASQLLDFQWGYFGGDLATWTAAQLSEMLLELYPRKVALEDADLPEVIRGAAAFLRFLAGSGVLSPGCDAEALAGLVEGLAGEFRSAMADQSRWGMGKRLLSSMAAEGLDPSDPAQVQEWMQSFNSRPFAERDALLGPLPGGGLGPPVVQPLPPVVLAPPDRLAAAARASLWRARVARLADFVGEGRPLTATGQLKLADGKALVGLLGTDDVVDEQIGARVFRTRSSAELVEVSLTVELATAAEVLRVRGRRLVPGAHRDLPEEDPLEAVYGLMLAWLHRLGPVRSLPGSTASWCAEELDRTLPGVLLDLYRARGPVALADLAEEAWEHVEDLYEFPDAGPDDLTRLRWQVGSGLRQALVHLAELGILTADDAARAHPSPYQAPRGTIAVSELGVWALQRLASRFTQAPVVGALAELAAPAMLARAADLPEAEARAEVDHWVEVRGAAAAGELVAALPGCGHTSRSLAFHALLRLGPAAAEAVATLSEDEELGAYARVWRVDTLQAASTEMTVGSPEEFVRLLAAVLDVWGPASLPTWAAGAAGPAGVLAVVERCWRVQLPHTEGVLAALGARHPDPQVAKAARKALFKLRSAPD